MPAPNRSEDKSIADRLRNPFGMTVIRTIATIVIGIALTIVLPTRFTEEIGAQRIAKMAAPFEGYFYDISQSKSLGGSEERPEIAIVTIDPDSLNSPPDGLGDGSWPAPYGYYASLLDMLASSGAKAVFLDVVLSHAQQKEEIDKLKESIDFFNKKSGGTNENPHVFLAAQRQRECPASLFINPDLNALEGIAKVGIEFSPNEVDRIAWTYPLVYAEPTKEGHSALEQAGEAASTKPACPEEHGAGAPRSAALAIYQTLGGKLQLNLGDEKEQTIGVTWGMETAANGLPWYEEEDEEKHARLETFFRFFDWRDKHDATYCTSSSYEPVLLIRAEARAWLRSASRPLCVYHPTYPASFIASKSPADRAPLLKNRIVLIGTSLRYSNDIVTSPLHDRIPGVFLHAMALDNLMRSDGKPSTNWEPPSGLIEGWNSHYIWLAAIGVLSIFLIRTAKDAAKRRSRRTYFGHHEHRKRLFSRNWAKSKLRVATFNILWFITTGLVLTVFAIALLLIGKHAMHLPYLVVAHLIACSLAVEWLEWGEKLADWLMDYHEEREHEKHED
jgi:hypothetical protein